MDSRKKSRFPRFIDWITRCLIANEYREEMIGDLREVYEDRLTSRGKVYAWCMGWVDAIHLVIGFSSLRSLKTQNNNIMMINNMFKVAWRNALRQKQFTALNLLGLTIGIVTCLTIGFYVHEELTYDTFHEKADRIYRVNQPNIWGDWNEMSSATGPNVAVALREDAPEFEEVTRLLNMGPQTVNLESEGRLRSFKETQFFIAEENLLDVFTFNFNEGDPETALSEANSMLLTQETAERYFGYEAALGKTVDVKDWDGSLKTYKVTGVLADVPHRSHLQFDILVSLSSVQENMDRDGWKWIWTAFSTYGLVSEGVNINALTEKLQAIPPKWAPPTTERIFNQTFDEFTAGNPWKLELQPLKEIYISGDPDVHNFGPTGNPQFVKIFASVGLLVLLLSAINFMNLSTARSTSRSKEVGVRKVLGSQRNGLIQQFIFESTLYVLVSTIAALIIVHFTLDQFNHIADTQLQLNRYIATPLFWGLVITFILGLGILSGSYPAFYLSSFRPIETLKSRSSSIFKGKKIRNGLVVFQFTISIALIICTFFVQRQLQYTSSLDTGFAKDNILQIHNIEQFGFDTEALKNQLAANAEFTKIGKSFGIPPNVWSGDRYRAKGPDNPVVQLRNIRSEEDYLELLGLEFVAGRNFDPSIATDKYHVILNEEAVRVLGWGSTEDYAQDSPIGKILALASGQEDEFEVIGVVEDFNFNSVRQSIAPLVIIHHQNDKVWDYGAGQSFLSMKLNHELVNNADDLQAIIEDVKAELLAMDPSVPFEYSFMDKDFEQTFIAERRMSSALNIFTLMALIIACLGLFGLAAFTAEQRVKELGIRKVLGAKVSQLVVLFSSEFTKLIIISILIAAPVAYLLVDWWLNDFAYRTPIDVWVFVVAAFIALAIAVLTISSQAVVAAFKNPVETLSEE